MSEREHLLIQKANEEVSKYKTLVDQDPYRLNYHLMPPVGLLNDPNGLIHFKGIYHVFYQWNPYDTAHGAKYWGHYTSKDLIHWEAQPIALAPSEWYEKNGCYSGSAVESDGELYLFYTGNVKQEDGTRETYQCLAVSSDGINFTKYGPVINLPEGYTAHFRDPKVWKHGDRWYMVVGAQTLANKGAIVLYYSKDLYHWNEAGKMAGDGMNDIKDFGYMWECPDLIHLNGKDILLTSPQGLEPMEHLYHNLFQSGYFIGELNYENHQFKHGPFTELDRGFDFYAPQTFVDDKGRTIMFGWMGITDEAEAYHPTVSHRWLHALTLPRVLTLKNEKVYQSPVMELNQLRKNQVFIPNLVIDEKCGKYVNLEGDCLELKIESIQLSGNEFRINFRNEAIFIYDQEKSEVSLQRRNVRTNLIESRTCKLDSLKTMQIFIDTSSLEIFINEGEETFTARYFPKLKEKEILFSGEGRFDLMKWDLA